MNIFEYDKGNAGESLAANYLAIIFNGEASRETMRGEGLGALDLQLKFPTYYQNKSHLQVAVQVKTGPSFATWTPSKSRWRLNNIDIGHIAKWKATNQPVLLIWVRLEPKVKLYWKLITSKTPLKTISVSESHVLNPSSRLEIERLLRMHQTTDGISKITNHVLRSTSEIRKWAKERFEKIRGVHECCLGSVTISNYAWRHLTRVTRPQSHIQDSLTVLPYVKQILNSKPHQIQTVPTDYSSIGNKILVRRKILAIYRDVRFSDKEVCVVYVRLDEKIEYRKDWLEKGLIDQKVFQELKLESIYRKTAIK